MENKLTAYEKKNYVFKEPRDYKILFKIKPLERKNLNKSQKKIVKSIRTQLKDDWRADLIQMLNKLIKNKVQQNKIIN